MFTWAAVPAGTYALVAKATDSNGVVGSSSAVNVVVGTPPPSTVLDVTISPNPVAAGVAATITVSGTNPCSMLWMDFGDGAWWIAPIGSLPYTTTHTWASGGSYTVLARGFVDCGGEVTRTVTVTGAPESDDEEAPSLWDPVPIRMGTWGLEDEAPSFNFTPGDASDGAEPSAEAPQSTAMLLLTLGGTGTGTVTSSPAGLTCTSGFGQTCTGTLQVGTIVTLTASPSATHTFSGWSGVCAGQGCTVELAGDRLVVAGFTNPPNLVLRFYHTDAIGSVRAITDEARQVLERFDYGPFGEGVGVTPSTSPLRFSGKTRDVESALDYFGARYYAGRIGQFTTVDPLITLDENLIDPQQWNRYVYVRNNPLRYTIRMVGRSIQSGISATSSTTSTLALRLETGRTSVSIS